MFVFQSNEHLLLMDNHYRKIRVNELPEEFKNLTVKEKKSTRKKNNDAQFGMFQEALNNSEKYRLLCDLYVNDNSELNISWHKNNNNYSFKITCKDNNSNVAKFVLDGTIEKSSENYYMINGFYSLSENPKITVYNENVRISYTQSQLRLYK